MPDTKLDHAIGQVEKALYNAQIDLLPPVLNNLQIKLRAERDVASINKISLLAANVARTINQPAVAVSMVENVLNRPAAGFMELFQSAKRLRVKLHLDAGEYAEAFALAETVDSLEVESAAFLKKDSAMVVATRNIENMSVETWLLLCEVACALNDADKAQECLLNARQRSFDDELVVSGSSMTLKERTAAQKRISDCRNEIVFWEAVVRIQRREAKPSEIYFAMSVALESGGNSDKRLLARVQAVSGNWRVGETAPAGISLAEANRLYQSCQPGGVVIDITKSDALTVVPLKPEISAADDELILPDRSLQNDNVTEILLQNQTQITTLTDLCRQLLEKSALEPSRIAGETYKSRSLAGALDKIMLPSLLELALASSLTGYFEVTWETDDLESSINAGLISPKARAGRAYIFLQNTSIVDATLGAFEPETSGIDDEDSVTEALTITIQISMGIGLDLTPGGYVFFRHSPAVALREARVIFDKNKVIDVIVSLDEFINGINSPAVADSDIEAPDFIFLSDNLSSVHSDESAIKNENDDLLDLGEEEYPPAEEAPFSIIAAL